LPMSPRRLAPKSKRMTSAMIAICQGPTDI
jgi:hypothetical protein